MIPMYVHKLITEIEIFCVKQIEIWFDGKQELLLLHESEFITAAKLNFTEKQTKCARCDQLDCDLWNVSPNDHFTLYSEMKSM